MTDDETDDDNDRMNRADRLREMREGRRRGRSRDANAEDTEATDTTADEAEATADSDVSADTSADDSPTDDGDDDGQSTADQTSSPDNSTIGDESEPSSADGTSSATDDQETEVAERANDQDDSEPAAVEESGFEFDDSTEKEVAHAEKAEKTDVEVGAAPDETTAEPQSGIAQTVSSTDAASAVDQLNAGSTFAIPDQATTVTEEDEGSTLDSAEQSVAAARAAAAARGTAHVGSRTRVLEFELGSERFCLDIDYIEEIVEMENMTRVPNSPSYVEGVVDLRGQVTTIINPKDALEVEKAGSGDLIIVFDSEEVGDQGHLGWVVDEVRQVTPVSDGEVNDSPDEDAEYINGIINREDEEDFVVWTTPELALNSS